MSDTAIPADPLLSPAFDRARNLSNVLAGTLSLCFWVALAWLVFFCAVIVSSPVFTEPKMPTWAAPWTVFLFSLGNLTLPGDLSIGPRAAIALAIAIAAAPSVFVFYFAKVVFQRFSAGNVFAAETIACIRRVAVWLMVAALSLWIQKFLEHTIRGLDDYLHVSIPILMFILGIATYVAAHVMAEARRIADDNASFV